MKKIICNITLLMTTAVVLAACSKSGANQPIDTIPSEAGSEAAVIIDTEELSEAEEAVTEALIQSTEEAPVEEESEAKSETVTSVGSSETASEAAPEEAASGEGDEIVSDPLESAQLLDVSNYFTGYKVLVEQLGMELTDSWQMSYDSYLVDGFYLEYNDEFGLCSMKNEGNSSISICGILPGMAASEAYAKAKEAGWAAYYETESGGCYFMRTPDKAKIYMMELGMTSSETVEYWYWNDWPEGDYSEFFEEQGWND